jgi:AcrR family transcriptional regulator
MNKAKSRAVALEDGMTDEDIQVPATIDEPKTPPIRRVKGAERRARFLEAAADIIIEQGVSFVTMEQVAARTNVSKRLGYRYFANREALLRTLFEQQMQEVTRRAAENILPHPELRAVIAAYIRAWLELSNEHGPLLSRLFSDQDVVPTVAREISENAIRNWADVIREPLGLSLSSATILSRMYLTALRGAVESLHAKTAPLEDIVEIYTTAIFAGAQAVATIGAHR